MLLSNCWTRKNSLSHLRKWNGSGIKKINRLAVLSSPRNSYQYDRLVPF
jgi:hypothetical protein